MFRVSTVCLGLLIPMLPAQAQHPLHHPVDGVELRFSRGQPDLPQVTARQRALRDAWRAATP